MRERLQLFRFVSCIFNANHLINSIYYILSFPDDNSHVYGLTHTNFNHFNGLIQCFAAAIPSRTNRMYIGGRRIAAESQKQYSHRNKLSASMKHSSFVHSEYRMDRWAQSCRASFDFNYFETPSVI